MAAIRNAEKNLAAEAALELVLMTLLPPKPAAGAFLTEDDRSLVRAARVSKLWRDLLMTDQPNAGSGMRKHIEFIRTCALQYDCAAHGGPKGIREDARRVLRDVSRGFQRAAGPPLAANDAVAALREMLWRTAPSAGAVRRIPLLCRPRAKAEGCPRSGRGAVSRADREGQCRKNPLLGRGGVCARLHAHRSRGTHRERGWHQRCRSAFTPCRHGHGGARAPLGRPQR